MGLEPVALPAVVGLGRPGSERLPSPVGVLHSGLCIAEAPAACPAQGIGQEVVAENLCGTLCSGGTCGDNSSPGSPARLLSANIII